MGVIDTVLAFVDLQFGRAAYPDAPQHRRELCQPLLKLLAVVVGGRLVDLRLDLVDAGLDVRLLAGAITIVVFSLAI